MRSLLLASALFSVVASQTYWCNYTATGDETIENAVPINTFRTSGSDFVRPQWCIAHCNDRKSIKAAMLFQPAKKTSAVYKMHTRRLADGTRQRDLTLLRGIPAPLSQADDDMFCVNQTVAATVDAVFDKYDDIETISEALNYYINKPGWAYLVYEMGPPPSIIGSVNVFQDPDFCMKTILKQHTDGSYDEYQMFSGLVQT